MTYLNTLYNWKKQEEKSKTEDFFSVAVSLLAAVSHQICHISFFSSLGGILAISVYSKRYWAVEAGKVKY